MPPSLPRVVVMVVMAMVLIVSGDAAAKVLGGHGFDPVFVAWSRFALAAAMIAPFAGLQRSDLAQAKDWRLVLRAMLIVGGIVCILTALRTEDMATVFGGFFVGPIVAYALSAILLREQVTLTRTVLLGLSFVGVLIVVRPGFGMTIGMGFSILAGCFHGSYLVATRWLAGGFRPRFLLLSQLVIGAVVLAPFAVGPLPAISGNAAVLIGISAMGSALGNLLLVLVNRSTPANVIAPLIYSQLVVATVLGVMVFGDWPDGTTLIGLAVIAIAGASSVWFAGRGR
ncbi:MAG: DMT family transporter [Yoonia sp.]|nr:DMT family transporter [Yoonia sp.]